MWSVQECANQFSRCLTELKQDLVGRGENGMLVWDKVCLNLIHGFIKPKCVSLIMLPNSIGGQ